MTFLNFVGTPLKQNATRQLFLIIAASIVMKGELANKTVNYRGGFRVSQESYDD